MRPCARFQPETGCSCTIYLLRMHTLPSSRIGITPSCVFESVFRGWSLFSALIRIAVASVGYSQLLCPIHAHHRIRCRSLRPSMRRTFPIIVNARRSQQVQMGKASLMAASQAAPSGGVGYVRCDFILRSIPWCCFRCIPRCARFSHRCGL